MLSYLAQYDSDFTYTVNGSGEVSNGGAAFFGGLMIFYLVILVLFIVAMWKVFQKAGEPGWKALVPIYNYWTLCQIAGRPGWWSLSFLLVAIPIVNIVGWIVPFLVSIVVSLDIGKAFKKSTAFSVVGLIIFSFIGYLILGFGKDKYHGANPVNLGFSPELTLKDGGKKSAGHTTDKSEDKQA